MVQPARRERPPSVDALARSIGDLGLPHPLLVDAARAAIAAGAPETARSRAEEVAAALLRPVVNATGVLLHTNLGRAPIEYRAEARATNLELDLATGRRGSRHVHAGMLLARAMGAEDALVVNNGAAAVLLVLTALAAGRPVLVSRGELVEIGGGFRVPDVLAASGARLIEVGTTNRTRVEDYDAALQAEADVALVLKVHQSNYRIVGFTESASVPVLSLLGPPLVVDLGSGLLDADAPWLVTGPPSWLADEPAARQSLEQGAALVTFSGDKLLGGPQAGIIAGRHDLVAACARQPLARALRPGSLVLGALQETALAYLRRDGSAIPFWRMATASLGELRTRAEDVAAKSGASIVDCMSVPGGGSLPGLEIPSVGLAVRGDRSTELRSNKPPVIARVRDGVTICDLRSVDATDDLVLASALGILRESASR
ncbi:MAG: L-seryl-tRNA(Sec) selenium transferase [Acidimicrobiales bacterium]